MLIINKLISVIFLYIVTDPKSDTDTCGYRMKRTSRYMSNNEQTELYII